MAPHPHAKKCSCCTMSRRCFMGSAAIAAASPLLAGLQPASAEPDLAGFHPRPEVRITGAFVRLKPPYWLGWPGASYDVEDHRKRFSAEMAQTAQRLAVQFTLEPDPLETEDAINAFAERVKAQQPHALLLALQHRGAWGWADRITQAGLPTIILAPIATPFTGHVLEIACRPGVHVISSHQTDAITQAFRIVRPVPEGRKRVAQEFIPG